MSCPQKLSSDVTLHPKQASMLKVKYLESDIHIHNCVPNQSNLQTICQDKVNINM